MKILVISHMFPCKRHPTSAIFFANLMKELASKVDELIIVTPRPYIPKLLTKINNKWTKWDVDPKVSWENGMEIIRPHVMSLPRISFIGINSILLQLSLFRFLRRIVRARQIDIILGYNMLPDGIAAVGLSKMLNLPAGFWAIGSDVNSHAKHNILNFYLSKKSINNSQIVFAESKNLANKIKEYSSNSSTNITTFYKGIDISHIESNSSIDVLYENLGLDPRKRYILFVGRLTREKGIYELANAFVNIADRYPDLYLLLVGEEFEKDKLSTFFSESKVLHRVMFIGLVPFNKVFLYMKCSSMLVFPSWAEGLPNVIMEAMASGLPVVATNVGGIPEILKSGITGLSVPPENSDKLTEAIIIMLENTQLRGRCVESARRLIIDNFDVKKNVYKLIHFLEKVRQQYYKVPMR